MTAKKLIFGALISISVIIVFFILLDKQEMFNFTRKYQKSIELLSPQLSSQIPFSKVVCSNSRLLVYSQDSQKLENYSISGANFILLKSLKIPFTNSVVLAMSDENNKISVFDARNHSLFEFSSPLDTCATINLGLFERASYLDKEHIIMNVFNKRRSDVDILRYNLKNKIQDTLDFPFSHVSDGAFANDGFYKRNAKDEIGIFLYHLGKFAIFDSTGRLKLKHETIDSYSKLPIVAKSGDGDYVLSRRSVIINKLAAMNTSYIFILSNVYSRDDYAKFRNKDQVIDIYNISTGNYIGSYSVKGDQKIIDFDVDDNHLYFITNKNIYVKNI